MRKVFVTIGVNLVNNVSAFDTPFAPLGLAIGWIKMYYIPFASLRLWQITYQHLPNAQTRIHNVGFGAEGV